MLVSEYADRSSLPFEKLEEFAECAVERGWFRVPTKGEFEVLRMKHPEIPKPLVLFRREHSWAVTIGKDQAQAREILAAWKAKNKPPRRKNERRRRRMKEIVGNLRAVEEHRDELIERLRILAQIAGVEQGTPLQILDRLAERLRQTQNNAPTAHS